MRGLALSTVLGDSQGAQGEAVHAPWTVALAITQAGEQAPWGRQG